MRPNQWHFFFDALRFFCYPKFIPISKCSSQQRTSCLVQHTLTCLGSLLMYVLYMYKCDLAQPSKTAAVFPIVMEGAHGANIIVPWALRDQPNVHIRPWVCVYVFMQRVIAFACASIKQRTISIYLGSMPSTAYCVLSYCLVCVCVCVQQPS